MQVTIPGTVGEILVSGDIGAQIDDPDYVVGFVIGQNNIVFRPGSVSPRGSLAVEGPGGFGAQDIGFVPPLPRRAIRDTCEQWRRSCACI